MLKDPLPRTLDVRKAAARGVSVEGSLELAELPRLRLLLAGNEGRVKATLALSRDEEHHCIIAVAVEAEVSVICQRCLEPMALPLACSNRLAVVWTDEQAKHLPKHMAFGYTIRGTESWFIYLIVRSSHWFDLTAIATRLRWKNKLNCTKPRLV